MVSCVISICCYFLCCVAGWICFVFVVVDYMKLVDMFRMCCDLLYSVCAYVWYVLSYVIWSLWICLVCVLMRYMEFVNKFGMCCNMLYGVCEYVWYVL